MSTWPPDVLKQIATGDLHVAPFREDGTTPGTPTLVWPLVVNDTVYVRAAHGRESRWYRAAMAQHAGRIRVAETDYDAAFESAGDTDADEIDAAYEAKYHGSSAVQVMQGDGPRSASVRIVPAAHKSKER